MSKISTYKKYFINELKNAKNNIHIKHHDKIDKIIYDVRRCNDIFELDKITDKSNYILNKLELIYEMDKECSVKEINIWQIIMKKMLSSIKNIVKIK